METSNNTRENLLPYDGTAIYFGTTMNNDKANWYYQQLFDTIAWKNDEAVIFGKHFITKRKVAWYGDARFRYTYSNTTKEALPWTPELLELKEIVEKLSGQQFNSCLLNLYHNGEEGMAWHSDDEKALGKDSAIGSFSLGAVRKFSFRHRKTKEGNSIMLENGSLLVMEDTTQTHWVHCLPKSKRVKDGRINLTFRTMVG